MIRAVLDPNMLVSALISPNGTPALVLNAAEEKEFEFPVSERLTSELEVVLMRGKFRRYASVEEAVSHIRRVREVGILAVEGEIVPVSPDPKDDYLVALALHARADYLVSGDPHLLGMDYELTVVSPRAFLDILESERSRGRKA